MTDDDPYVVQVIREGNFIFTWREPPRLLEVMTIRIVRRPT